MTGTPHIVSAGIDMRGANALPLLPKPGEAGEEAMIFAGSLRQSDAWTGTAFRALIEYHGRSRSRRVVLGPPDTKTAANNLYSLIGAQNAEDLPRHFCLVDDAAVPEVKVPRIVALPAQRIEHYTIADSLVDILPRCLAGFVAAPSRMVEKAFGELVNNSLEWGASSPIGTVVTVAHERERHVLQVVVSDLGRELVRANNAADRLADMASRSSSQGLGWSGLIAEAERRDLMVEIHVAAGVGRMDWQPGEEPTISEAQLVGGFTAALEVAL